MISESPKYLGRYYTGQSARAIDVTIICGMTLDFHDDDREVEECWAWDDLTKEDALVGQCRLSNGKEHPNARLETSDRTLIKIIKEAAPALERKRKMERSGRNKIIIWIMAAIISLVGIVFYGIPVIATRIAPLVPLAWEAKLGNLLEPQLAKVFQIEPLETHTCSTPAGDAAMAKMLQKVRGEATLPFEPRVKVIRHKMKNAFALPGGSIYFMNGLIKEAKSAEAVAGVLAHEIGHVKARDTMRKIAESSSRSFIISLLLGDITGSTVIIFARQTMLGAAYSRDIENEADGFAIARLNEAGFSGKPMADLLASIGGKTDKKSATSLISTHPLTSERTKRLTDNTPSGQNNPVLSAGEWDALRTICD
jgi:Zn-dependent protease with chaperone function